MGRKRWPIVAVAIAILLLAGAIAVAWINPRLTRYIETYTPIPEPTPTKSWLHVFLPERVYLKRVWSEPADVTWGLRGKKCGLFGTRLLITPHGRDFEYQATGGTTKMPVMPEMQLRHTHLLVTKTWLSLYDFDLAANE